MRGRFAAWCLLALSLLPFGAKAQGTLPIVLSQQFSFSGCATTGAICGTPLIGGLLYFFQVGTVATPQNSYQDTGLTVVNPNPLILDANGRVPAFYLANGFIHVRLTDASGVVQFDYPNMLVIGPSGGSGGGGSSIDPTTILSTGDIKFRATAETLTGWVRMNGLTIGSGSSGATERANADTQSLFTYLWTNCAQPNANNHCPVVGGIGASAAADFGANKQITLFDCRGRICGVGLDTMGNTAAGRLLASQITSGGSDGVTTPNATGGASTTTIAQANLPNYNLTVTDPVYSFTWNGINRLAETGLVPVVLNIDPVADTAIVTLNKVSGGVVNSAGSGTPANTISPFILGTWFLKL